MNCRYGVSLEDSSNCSVTGNIVGAETGAFIGGTNPVLTDAIRVFGNSDANTITGNTIKGASASYKYSNGIGINTTSATENMVSSNVIDDSTVTQRISDLGTRTNIVDRGFIGVSTTSGGKLLVGGGLGSAIEFNDSSTRLEIPAANNLSFFTSNTERLRINASGDINATGILTATSFVGDLSDSVTSRWDVGANGSSHYTFTGPGGLSSTDDPTIYLARGQTYEFNVNASGHPFYFQTSSGAFNGANVLNSGDGVTNNGAASGVIKFETKFTTQNTLYYVCQNHSNMNGTVVIYPSI